jgi:aminoglycoside phosphotransferase (APT) family kinase protein
VKVDTDLSGRLLAVLRTASDTPTLHYEKAPEQMSGGFWAELLAFTLADPPAGWPAELVVRLMPDPRLAYKETIVQRAVAASGFPTPSVRASGGSDEGLGRAFMVMDRATGSPQLSGLNGLGAVASGLRLHRQIPESLAAPMAKLHRLDIRDVRDRLNEIHDLPINVSQLLTELVATAHAYRRGDLAHAAEWLQQRSYQSDVEVVCHGDLHPFNVLVDGDRLTVLDWSAALLGAPAYDVAFTSVMLSEPPLVVPGPLRSLIRRVGAGLARRFIAAYERHAEVSVEPEQLKWHQGLVCLRALVEVAGWVRQGDVAARAGHPWLVSGSAIADRLGSLTGVRISPR